MITNSQSKTRIDEIADGIYRINTPVEIAALPGGFNFSQYLVLDDEPLLFHTGLRRAFPLVQEAISKIMPVSRLRHLGLSHFEADEAGAMNQFLEAAPDARPLCSEIGAMTSVNDVADRPARAIADGEELPLGKHRLKWIYTPHVPHGWDCGVLFDMTTQTLLCGDLFTHGGLDNPPVTEKDILGPSELFRKPLDYFAHSVGTSAILERLAALRPGTLACMHGSAFRGDGGALLVELSEILARERSAALEHVAVQAATGKLHLSHSPRRK
jgi:flavorubredoxin